MALTRSKKSFYLIGTLRENNFIDERVLPTTEQVLKRLFYIIKEQKMTISDGCNQLAGEIFEIWEKASIPTSANNMAIHPATLSLPFLIFISYSIFIQTRMCAGRKIRNVRVPGQQYHQNIYVTRVSQARGIPLLGRSKNTICKKRAANVQIKRQQTRDKKQEKQKQQQ